MGTKQVTKEKAKTDDVKLKSLFPVFLLGTAIMVAIGLIGRKSTEK